MIDRNSPANYPVYPCDHAAVPGRAVCLSVCPPREPDIKFFFGPFFFVFCIAQLQASVASCGLRSFGWIQDSMATVLT